MCVAAADITFKSRLIDKGTVVFGVVLVVAVRDKIAQMLGVLVALAVWVVFGMLCAHG